MSDLLSLLASDVLRYPLIIAVLIGLTAPVVGTYLVQKRLALLGDGLGHVAQADHIQREAAHLAGGFRHAVEEGGRGHAQFLWRGQHQPHGA